MILDRIGLLRAAFREKREASAAAERWVAADQADPELALDILRMGGVLTLPPRRFVDGIEVPDPIDPIRLAKQEGRRELALELLALMKLSAFELSQLMEEEHVR